MPTRWAAFTAMLLITGSCVDSGTGPLPCSTSVAGRCWSSLGPSGTAVSAIAFRGDQIWIGTVGNGLQLYDRGARHWLPRGFVGKTVTSIAVVPPTLDLWVTVSPLGSDTVSAVAYESSDDGASWQPRDGGISAARSYRGVAFDVFVNSSDPKTLFLGLSAEIARSNTSGTSWTDVYGDSQALGVAIAPLVVAASRPARMWAGGQSAFQSPVLLRSDDTGATWTELSPCGTCNPELSKALATDPVDPNQLLVGMFGQVRLTTDSGTTWQTVLVPNVPGLFNGVAWTASHTYAAADLQPGPGQTQLGLFVGSAAGGSWDTLPVPTTASGATSLALDSTGMVFVGTWTGLWALRAP